MADKILAHLDALDPASKANLAEYENGREHGYVITDEASGRSATFAENRNSDDAVVYFVDWNNDSEDVKDAAYRSKRLFPYNRPDLAAEAIVEHFQNYR